MRFEIIEGYPSESLVQQICSLSIPTYPSELFNNQLSQQKNILSCLAFDREELIAFKIGYQPRPKLFESFLGFVSPNYRRKGVGTHLIEIQHNWCSKNEYHYINTIAASENNAMLILNLKSGFNITGTFLDRGKNQKIILQKQLPSLGLGT